MFQSWSRFHVCVMLTPCSFTGISVSNFNVYITSILIEIKYFEHKHTASWTCTMSHRCVITECQINTSAYAKHRQKLNKITVLIIFINSWIYSPPVISCIWEWEEVCCLVTTSENNR